MEERQKFVFKNKVVVTTNITTDVIEAVPGYYAYRHTFETVTDEAGKKAKTEITTKSGICDEEGLKNLRLNNNKKLLNDNTYREGYGTTAHIINDDMLEKIKMRGYSGLSDVDYRQIEKEPDFYAYFEEDKDPKNVIRFRGYDHILFTLDGKVMPSGGSVSV